MAGVNVPNTLKMHAYSKLQSITDWRPVLYEGYCLGFAETTETFFREAVEPANRSLQMKVKEEKPTTPQEKTRAQLDKREDLRTAELEMNRSFALALSGMWERHFRQVLWNAAVVLLPKNEQKSACSKAKKGTWDDL